MPDGETRSITQLEYEAALLQGGDVLAYLLDEGTGWDARFDERARDPEIGAWRTKLAE